MKQRDYEWKVASVLHLLWPCPGRRISEASRTESKPTIWLWIPTMPLFYVVERPHSVPTLLTPLTPGTDKMACTGKKKNTRVILNTILVFVIVLYHRQLSSCIITFTILFLSSLFFLPRFFFHTNVRLKSHSLLVLLHDVFNS